MSAATSFLPNHRHSMKTSVNGVTGDGMLTSRGSAPFLYDDNESDAGNGTVAGGGSVGGSIGNLYTLYEATMKTSDGSGKGLDCEPTQDNTPVGSHSFRKKPTRTSLERIPNQLPSLNPNPVNTPTPIPTSVLPVTGTSSLDPSIHKGSVDGLNVVDIEAPASTTIVV